MLDDEGFLVSRASVDAQRDAANPFALVASRSSAFSSTPASRNSQVGEATAMDHDDGVVVGSGGGSDCSSVCVMVVVVVMVMVME